jgi:hypothetical protein
MLPLYFCKFQSESRGDDDLPSKDSRNQASLGIVQKLVIDRNFSEKNLGNSLKIVTHPFKIYRLE